SCERGHRDLHPVPTRRSSDLAASPPPPLPEDRAPARILGGLRNTDRAPLSRADLQQSPSADGCDCDTAAAPYGSGPRHCLRPASSEEHTSELQSRDNLVCRLL